MVESLPGSRRPSVLIVGSEALPFSKTGGLADVLAGLPPALARAGWVATLVVPRYRDSPDGPSVLGIDLTIGGRPVAVELHEVALTDGARAILVDAPDLFDREHLYSVGSSDYPDNPRRFAALVRAALEFAARTGERPSVVHAHDWQAALAPVYLKTLYAMHPVLAGTPSVFTIHNMAYQGVCERDWLPRLDLPWSVWTPERLEYWGRISFLKGGIADADAVTTVSPTYAKEIQTALGFGLEGLLQHRHADLFGVLNGIDTDVWNPARDPFLPAPYDAERLEAKKASKRSVLARYSLPDGDENLARPLVAMISRMVDQKGFDLIAGCASVIPTLDASFVVLGTGEDRYQDLWRDLAARSPDRIGVKIGFDEGLAHLIEGGADIFLMPSRFEPCGLNQMYSLRYGTIPVVRRVGGLADTVTDEVTGFTFDEYSPEALLRTLGRALAAYQNPREWRRMQLAGMKEDHSWDRAAREYVTIYERVAGVGPGSGLPH
jgi:starch synthase